MTDSLQWLINLMVDDLFRIVAALIILMFLVELLSRVREWLK